MITRLTGISNKEFSSFSLSNDDQKNYDRHLGDFRYWASMVWSMKMDAEYEIKNDEKFRIAKELKKNGVSIDVIVKSTGLKKDETPMHNCSQKIMNNLWGFHENQPFKFQDIN